MKETTLITGASSGIGYEIALMLAAQKNDLVLTARNIKKLNALKEKISTKHDVKVWVIAKDLSQTNSARELYDEIKNNDIKITQLINNAGFGEYGQFTDIDINQELRMIQLNISSLVALTKYFLTDMKQNDYGRILNVASVVGFFPMPLYSVYAATKSFVLSFSEALSNELKESNISVTCLCPGATATNFTDDSEMEQSGAYRNMPQASPQAVAKTGINAMQKGKRLAVHGLLNKFLIFSTRLAPRSLVLKIARLISSK